MFSTVPIMAVAPLTRPLRFRKFRSSTVKYWHIWGTSASSMAPAWRTGVPSLLSSAARMASRPLPKPAAVGIHNMNVPVRVFLLQLLLGIHGRLIGAADAGGHGDVDRILPRLQHGSEVLHKQMGIQKAGGDLRTAAQRVIIVVHIEAVHIALIFLLHAVHTVGAGQHGNALQAALRQIGAAVRKYDKRHRLLLQMF